MGSSKAMVIPILVLAGLLCFPTGAWSQQARSGPILVAMKQELDRSMKGLKKKGDPQPYFISYHVNETRETDLSACYGAIGMQSTDFSRWLDVEVRVGDYKLDNTHRIKTRGGFYGFRFPRPVAVPVEDDKDTFRSLLWLETDNKYKQAVERLGEVKRDRTLRVEEEDESDDFSREPAHHHVGALADVSPDVEAWKKKLREYSRLFLSYPEIYESRVSLRVLAKNKYIVNTEGTELQHGRTFVRLSFHAQARAEDGMKLYLHEAFDVSSPKELPESGEVKQAIKKLAEDLRALRGAPVMEPYTGPAILTGKAAGVFFHEIFGHRVEGHRQKDERDGQTFTKKVGERILPDFVSVIDDPTVESAEGKDLRGHYRYDDQGVLAQKVTVVKNGVLKNFLMSRTPVMKFNKSNGHGRAQQGYSPVARQGSLFVRGSRTVPEKQLREMLVEECKKQNKPYGLLFTEVSGGFTYTGRVIPQMFNVHPLMVYRVYTDGRSNELVRGVELIGTPLTSFSRILALGDKNEVFNGTCGAESGGVPVSAVSPSVLTGQIEVQKKEKSPDRPPLLPPPAKGVK